MVFNYRGGATLNDVPGNALILDIPNAVLALPEGDEFQAASPAEGIAFLSATNLPDNRIRVAITGSDGPPAADVRATPQGLGAGIGLFFVDERPGDLENSFTLPSYLRTDAAVYYRRENWRAALNFKNLFDVRYFESSAFGRERITPGAPFTIIGSVAVEF